MFVLHHCSLNSNFNFHFTIKYRGFYQLVNKRLAPKLQWVAYNGLCTRSNTLRKKVECPATFAPSCIVRKVFRKYIRIQTFSKPAAIRAIPCATVIWLCWANILEKGKNKSWHKNRPIYMLTTLLSDLGLRNDEDSHWGAPASWHREKIFSPCKTEVICSSENVGGHPPRLQCRNSQEQSQDSQNPLAAHDFATSYGVQRLLILMFTEAKHWRSDKSSSHFHTLLPSPLTA